MEPSPNVPRRLSRAVERLDIAGHERILEIGCGRGIAVSLVCPLLHGGTIMAIDRSAAAIAAARARNRGFSDSGKAGFLKVAIEDLEGPAGALDLIFAVNVNLFWLEAARGLAAVRRLLAEGGRLELFYEPPEGRTPEIRLRLLGRLEENGFAVLGEFEEDAGRSCLFGVTARPG